MYTEWLWAGKIIVLDLISLPAAKAWPLMAGEAIWERRGRNRFLKQERDENFAKKCEVLNNSVLCSLEVVSLGRTADASP